MSIDEELLGKSADELDLGIVQSQLMSKENKTRNELFSVVADAPMKLSSIAAPFATLAALAARLIHYGNENTTHPLTTG